MRNGGKMKGQQASLEVGYTEQALLQEDELMALEAILPCNEVSRLTGSALASAAAAPSSVSSKLLRLSVPAVLPSPAKVAVRTHIYSVIEGTTGDEKSLARELGDAPLSKGARRNQVIYERVEETHLDRLCHLPPLEILIRLPAGYPTLLAPEILHIRGDYLGAACTDLPISNNGIRKAKGLASLAAASLRTNLVQWLRHSLLQQWETVEVLYTWYEYLKESMWQEVLSGGSCPLVDSLGTLTFDEYVIEDSMSKGGGVFESPLATSLRLNDILCKRKEFEGERFGCGICLEEKRGGKCWKVSECGHVFCQECLTGYLSSMIREGYIRQASACPDPDCVKARVAAENKVDADHIRDVEERRDNRVGSISTAEMLQFVGPELVKRLEDLRDKALASTDPSAGYCPRPGCEKLVRADPKDIGTSYESMRMCECGFTYCLYCNKAWHGKSPCNLVSSTALIEQYQRATEGSTMRKEMEFKYGKANLERMIRNHEEEVQNREYIESHTQGCPCCSVRIEKSMGCNHMTCHSCNTHLCYRCGTRLDPREPYRHFNTPGAPCYQKLFDVILEGGVGDGWIFPGANEDDMAQWEAEEL